MPPLGERVPLLLLAALLLCLVLVLLIRHIRKKPLPMDMLEGHDFEHYCAGLLESEGFFEVEVTKASHDFGLDILAKKDGISYGIQCKRYDHPVGVHAIEEVYAGKDYYNRMVGAVMTNTYFTEDAVKMAKKLRILLWDREVLEEMERGDRR